MRSFGTESRKADACIDPTATVYEFIIFRGSDIKDLQVFDDAKKPGAAPAPVAVGETVILLTPPVYP